MSKPWTPTPQELKAILDDHAKWMMGDGGKANLEHACLKYADLKYANLGYANLEGANLGYANLEYANLEHANLEYANLGHANLGHANLTGELWETFLSEVVPALLVAGGKTVEDVIKSGAWGCHQWSNCPMHVGLGISAESEAPPLLRPRVSQFVKLFDAGLILVREKPDGGYEFYSPEYVVPEPATK